MLERTEPLVDGLIHFRAYLQKLWGEVNDPVGNIDISRLTLSSRRIGMSFVGLSRSQVVNTRLSNLEFYLKSCQKIGQGGDTSSVQVPGLRIR